MALNFYVVEVEFETGEYSQEEGVRNIDADTIAELMSEYGIESGDATVEWRYIQYDDGMEGDSITADEEEAKELAEKLKENDDDFTVLESGTLYLSEEELDF